MGQLLAMPRWSPILTSCFLALASGLAFAPAVQAGPVEALVQVALHPKNPDVMVLRHEFGGEGIFISKDRGKSWSYVCNSFIDPSMQARRGTLSVAGDGAVLLGVFDGVWRGDANGCGWALDDALKTKWVPDLTQDPIDADVMYAITSNGNPGSLNGVMRRDGSGNWTDLGSKAEMLLTRLRVAKNGAARRFYQSAVEGMRMIDGVTMPVPNYTIRVSDDDGATWQKYPFDTQEASISFRMLAVDPTNPDRIVAWIDREVSTGNQDSVLVSSNRGETFSEYLKLTDFGGITFAPDGRVWLADRGSTTDPDALRGLWSAANLDTAATHLQKDTSFACLAYQAESEVLYGCQLRKFGSLDPADGTFTELFSFNKVEKFVECEGAEPMADACESQLCRDYCILGHFPETPMCVAYQTTSCGPCSAIPQAEGCTLTGTAGTGGAGGASGGGGAAGIGMSGGSGGSTSAGSGGSSQPNTDGGVAGVTPDAGDDEGGGDDGGCSVAAAGAGERSALLAPMLAAVLAVCLRLRVRRRARPRT